MGGSYKSCPLRTLGKLSPCHVWGQCGGSLWFYHPTTTPQRIEGCIVGLRCSGMLIKGGTTVAVRRGANEGGALPGFQRGDNQPHQCPTAMPWAAPSLRAKREARGQKPHSWSPRNLHWGCLLARRASPTLVRSGLPSGNLVRLVCGDGHNGEAPA